MAKATHTRFEAAALEQSFSNTIALALGGKAASTSPASDEWRRAVDNYVRAAAMAEAMGLDWEPQRKRIYRDPVLSEGTSIMKVPFGRGGAQDMVCIKLELVNGWLFGIDSSRIKDETVRERVILYQRECYQVLHDHFSGKRKAGPEVDGDPTEVPTTSERLRLVTEARQSFSQQAAREMWFHQGLPIVPSMVNPTQNDLFHYGMINHGSEQAA